MKIFLSGRRSIRNPFSYPEYRKLFEKKFAYMQQPEDADFLIFSCLMDIRDSEDEVGRILTIRPDIQLVILSEEPLWDTVYSDNFLSKKIKISAGAHDYPCTFLNHATTRIFDFEKIPYFLTTSDDYFARYSFLFNRNSVLKGAEIKSVWMNAPINVAFYAEYRDEVRFDAHFPEQDVRGLSRYRTMVARAVKDDGVIRIGKGWGTKIVRQKLPDWHLDKLAALNRKCLIMSGMENTHQRFYITEKIFDSFAVLAVPLYWGGQKHEVMRIVPASSFINLHNFSIHQAADKICSFRPDKNFLDQYREAQYMLAEKFSQPMFLVKERLRVVSEIISEFDAL